MVGATADDWWRRAADELAQARVLKKAGHHDGAYFHAGQAVEFGIKALLLRRKGWATMPDTHKGARWHDLPSCADAARLTVDLNRKETPRVVRENWLTVKDWRSNARFPDMKVRHQEMVDLFAAVCNDKDGVWRWLESIYQNA